MQAATMAPRTSITTSVLVFVLTATAAASTWPTGAATSPPSPKAPPPPPPCAAPVPVAAFLRTRCAASLYPVTCYDTLIPYGCAFGTNPVRLARAATDVNAAQLRALSTRAKEAVARGGQPQQGVAYYKLRDCASSVSSAAGLAKQSAAELVRLDAMGSNATVSQVRWAISNAQTWLSASMTNEATCAEGLVPWRGASPAAKELVAGAVAAMESTSVALTLVNGLRR